MTDWYTKNEAAEMLDVSTKTIEQMAKRGSLRQGVRKNPGTGAKVAVYNPEDVQREAAARGHGPESQTFSLIPPLIPPVIPPPVGANGQRAEIEQLAAKLADRLTDAWIAPPLSEKLYLTMDEALLLSGLPHGILMKMAKAGYGFQVRNKGHWLINSAKLMTSLHDEIMGFVRKPSRNAGA